MAGQGGTGRDFASDDFISCDPDFYAGGEAGGLGSFVFYIKRLLYGFLYGSYAWGGYAWHIRDTVCVPAKELTAGLVCGALLSAQYDLFGHISGNQIGGLV